MFTHFTDLHASHVSHKVDDVCYWWVTSNTVPLCSCPMSICVHLYVSLSCIFFLCIYCLSLLYLSTSSFMCSSHPCLCVPVFGSLSSLFVFHPCLFIRWTFQQSGTERGERGSTPESTSLAQRAISCKSNITDCYLCHSLVSTSL